MRARSGMTLVTAIIFMFVFGLLLTSVSLILVANMKSEKHLRLMDDRDILARIVAEAVSCTRTFEVPCSDKPPIQMQRIQALKANGEVLISIDGTLFGDWTLLAYCSNGYLEVKSAKLRDKMGLSSDNPKYFVEDPLTHRPLWWQDPRSYLIPPRTPSEPAAPAHPGEWSAGGFQGSIDGKQAIRETHPAYSQGKSANTFFCPPRDVGALAAGVTSFQTPYVAKAAISAFAIYPLDPQFSPQCSAGASGINLTSAGVSNTSPVRPLTQVTIPGSQPCPGYWYLVLGE